MALSPIASLAGLPGPTGGGLSSNAKAPTDPKQNKEWVAKMFEQQFWQRQKEMHEKAMKKLEQAMKSKDGGGFTPV